MEGSIDLKPRVCFAFEVEKIIDVSSDGNYQVQWAPAWVSRFHLVGCEHLIQQFLQQQPPRSIEHCRQNEIQCAISSTFNEKQHGSAAITEEHFRTSCITNSDAVEYNENDCLLHSPHSTMGKGACYSPSQICEEQLTSENSLEINGDAVFHRSDEGRQQYRSSPSDGSKTESRTIFVPTSNEHQFKSLNRVKDLDVVDNLSLDLSHNDLHMIRVENIKTETTDEEVNTDSTLPELFSTPMEHVSFNMTECGDEVSADGPSSKSASYEKLHLMHTENNEINNNNVPNSHINSNPVEPLTCCYCKKTFTRRYGLQQHMRIHTGKRNSYPCLYCHSKFTRRDNLKRHLLTHSGKKHYSCALCGKSFTQKGTLNTHMLTHASRDHRYGHTSIAKK